MPLTTASFPSGLSLEITVTTTRRRRGKCPICGHRRILVALDAFAAGQPVGYGVARCLADAGMRGPVR